MSLEFADFAHYYQGLGLSEDGQREHFEIYASLMESLVQLFWDEEAAPNRLGIKLNFDAIPSANELDSEGSLQSRFNCAACPKAARKKEL